MTTQQKLIRPKLGLVDLASYLGNASEAFRTLGYSRDTFYRLKARFGAAPARADAWASEAATIIARLSERQCRPPVSIWVSLTLGL